MIGFNKKILYECFIKLSIKGEYILFTASSLRVGRSFESPRLFPSHAWNLVPSVRRRKGEVIRVGDVQVKSCVKTVSLPHLIFASQVSDSLTLTYPLADLASIYMMCADRDSKASNQITLGHQHEKNVTLLSEL